MNWSPELVGKSLEWRKAPGEKRTYALMAGEDRIASLRREKSFGTLASAESSGHRWSFKRVGFLRCRVTIRMEGSEVSDPEYHPRWTGGGELVFADGRRFSLKQRSFWQRVWIFVDPEGQELIRFRRGRAKAKGRVEVTPAGAQRAELPLLALLGWYLILLMAQDVAASSAAAAGAAAAG